MIEIILANFLKKHPNCRLLSHRNNQAKKPHQNLPMKNLFNEIDKLVKFTSAGNNAYTPLQVFTNAYWLIVNTRNFQITADTVKSIKRPTSHGPTSKPISQQQIYKCETTGSPILVEYIKLKQMQQPKSKHHRKEKQLTL